MREISLRMVRPQSAVGESAESKAIDKTQLDTQLASFARRSGSARKPSAGSSPPGGLEPKEDGSEAKYNESYDVGEATGEDQGADAREGRPRVTRKPRQSRLTGAFAIMEGDYIIKA